jgi:hypothetical protein
MDLLLTPLKKILFWSYDRGTWQYDLLCVLILAFIFLSPNYLFRSGKPIGQKDVQPAASTGEVPTAPDNSLAARVTPKATRAQRLMAQNH